MLELAQTAAESCNAATPDGASAQTSAFSAAVAAALPDIYAVLDGEPSSDASSLSTALLGSDNIDATFSEEGTRRRCPRPSSPARPLPCSIPAMR